MDPRPLSYITLNRPKIYYVLKISSKVVMVHFVVVKPTGCSTLWSDFKYFKKNLLKNTFSLFGNTFRWRFVSFKDQSNWFAVRIKRLFTEKFICYVLNIVNNSKYLFIYSFIFFTIYCMSQWIAGETLIFWVNVKATRFLLLVSWVWVGLD